MRPGSRLPARMRPSRAIRAKGRPLWRVEGDPPTGRPRTMGLPARERRQRLPPRSRHRRRPPPPPRRPGSRRHLALRRLPISARPRSGPHLPPAATPPPGRTRLQAISLRQLPNRNRGRRRLRRRTGSATRRPVEAGVGESRRPRRRLLPLRPPRIRRARASRVTSGRAARRSRLASGLRVLAGRRTPLGPLGDPASTGRPARHRRHCRPDRRRLCPLAPTSSPAPPRARRSRRRHPDCRMLRRLEPLSSPGRIRATILRFCSVA